MSVCLLMNSTINSVSYLISKPLVISTPFCMYEPGSLLVYNHVLLHRRMGYFLPLGIRSFSSSDSEAHFIYV